MVTVIVPGTRVAVNVVVVDGVGMAKQAQALDTYADPHVLGIPVGFLKVRRRFSGPGPWAAGADTTATGGAYVYALLKQLSVMVVGIIVVVRDSVCSR